MDEKRIRMLLEQKGELLVTVEEVGTVELHLHDTTLLNDEVRVDCTDGMAVFPLDRVVGASWHEQSLHDIGVE